MDGLNALGQDWFASSSTDSWDTGALSSDYGANISAPAPSSTGPSFQDVIGGITSLFNAVQQPAQPTAPTYTVTQSQAKNYLPLLLLGAGALLLVMKG